MAFGIGDQAISLWDDYWVPVCFPAWLFRNGFWPRRISVAPRASPTVGAANTMAALKMSDDKDLIPG